jgi:sarcosine/dimethylglycine N-methyltransferase
MAFPVAQKSNDSLSMALYESDRVFNEFNELLRTKSTDSITVDDLLSLDQMHYLGRETLDEAARVLGIQPDQNLIDVGAGYGGPARYLASRFQCNVTCLELQKHIHDVAQYFTDLVGLGSKVRHIHGDLISYEAPSRKYDNLLSLLVILHISEKGTAFQKIAGLLKGHGKIYIEDFYEKSPLTTSEKHDLKRIVSCPSLLTKDEYVNDLKAAGFKDIEFLDMGEKWLPFVRERNQNYDATKTRQIAVHGKQLADALSVFYSTIVKLFEDGNLGGVRLVATKQ